jgi:hypothetical protein
MGLLMHRPTLEHRMMFSAPTPSGSLALLVDGEPLGHSPSQWHLLLAASRGLGALGDFLGAHPRGLRFASIPTVANAIDPRMR